MKNFGTTAFALLLILGLTTRAFANEGAGRSCPIDLFGDGKTNAEPVSEGVHWNSWIHHFEGLTKGRKNPFYDVQFDSNATGRVHLQMRKALPVYSFIAEKTFVPILEEKKYFELKKAADEQLSKLNAHSTDVELFAAADVSRWFAMKEAEIQNLKRETKEEQKKQEEEKKKKEKEKKKKEKKDQPPEDPWDKRKEKYDPQNADVQPDDSGGGKGIVFFSTTGYLNSQESNNPSHKLFARTYYDVVTTEGIASNPSQRPVRQGGDDRNLRHARIKTFGKQEIDLLNSYGYEYYPQRTSQYEVVEAQPGVFTLRFFGEVPEEILVGQRAIGKLAFKSALQEAAYAKKSGLDESAWPEKIQIGIALARDQGGSDPMRIAAILEKWLAKDGGFMYSTSAGKDLTEAEFKQREAEIARLISMGVPKPIAMTRVGMFKCDGAAQIGVLLLRDFFGIKSRTVSGGGSQGFVVHNGKEEMAIDTNYTRHAWLEIFVNGEWHPFDMTPKNNSPDMSGDNESEIVKQHRSDEPPPPATSSQGQQQQQKSEKTDKEESKSDQEEKADKEKKEGQGEDKDKNGEETGELKKETEDKVKITQNSTGSGSSRPNVRNIILRETLAHTAGTLIREGDKTGPFEKIIKAVSSIMKGSLENPIRQMRGALQAEMNPFFEMGGKSFAELASQVNTALGLGKINEAYLKAQQLRELIKHLSKYRALTAEELATRSALEEFLTSLKRVNNPHAKSHELVRQFMADLPGPISRKVILKLYGSDVLTAGSANQQKLAAEIASPSKAENGMVSPVQQFLRIAAAHKYLTMNIRGYAEPSYKDEKTFMRSPTPKDNNDIVIAKSALEFGRMLLNPQPGAHIFADLFAGKQYALGTRETVRNPTPKVTAEKKISIVFYDISGSMAGEKVTVQDALLAAYVDKALSEKDVFGKPLHEVIIVPFGDTVHPGVHIKTVEDAENFIIDKTRYATAAEESTQIQLALEAFFDLVEEAAKDKQKQRIRNLDRANLVLMTDGGGTVNYAELTARRNNLMKKVPGLRLLMNFIAVNETNEQLEQMANDSKKLAEGQSFFNHLTPDIISGIYQKGDGRPADPDAFFTTHETPDSQMLAAARKLNASIASFKSEVSAAEIAAYNGRFKVDTSVIVKEMKGAPLSYLQELDATTEILTASDEMPRALRRAIVKGILDNYPKWVGRDLQHLSLTEEKRFNELLQWSQRGAE